MVIHRIYLTKQEVTLKAIFLDSGSPLRCGRNDDYYPCFFIPGGRPRVKHDLSNCYAVITELRLVNSEKIDLFKEKNQDFSSALS